ncbi:hypothetical protein DMA11_23070 [Marinilabiliaceae bacterium JC017]|nr:hypothetical protein DMA11_23070 [Marinilabiliaceae bacterium JC017]
MELRKMEEAELIRKIDFSLKKTNLPSDDLPTLGMLPICRRMTSRPEKYFQFAIRIVSRQKS